MPSIGRRAASETMVSTAVELLVEANGNRAVPPRVRRADRSGRSQTRAPHRAVRPPRRTSASGTRSSPPAAVLVSCSSTQLRSLEPSHPYARLAPRSLRPAQPDPHLAPRSTTEPPALHWAPLNSTKARRDTGIADREISGAGRSAGPPAPRRTRRVPTAAPRGGHADQRHDVAPAARSTCGSSWTHG